MNPLRVLFIFIAAAAAITAPRSRTSSRVRPRIRTTRRAGPRKMNRSKARPRTRQRRQQARQKSQPAKWSAEHRLRSSKSAAPVEPRFAPLLRKLGYYPASQQS